MVIVKFKYKKLPTEPPVFTKATPREKLLIDMHKESDNELFRIIQSLNNKIKYDDLPECKLTDDIIYLVNGIGELYSRDITDNKRKQIKKEVQNLNRFFTRFMTQCKCTHENIFARREKE